MASFTFERRIAAPPQTVFAVLTEHHLYSKLIPIRSSVLEREGDPAPNGVGAIRALRTIGPLVREEVVAYDPPTRFSYKLLSGAPVRDHLSTIELRPAGDHTEMIYAVRLLPAPRVPAALAVNLSKLSILALIRGVVRESERRGGA